MVEVDFLFDEFQFNFILFFILLAIAYSLGKYLQFEEFSSILVLHAILLVIFTIIQLIDYMFLLIAVVELVVIMKLEKNVEVENNGSSN
jgi:hypothetical membrane protein